MSNIWADGELESLCEKLFKATQGVLTWSWDEQLLAALAQFSVQDAHKVSGLLDPVMDARWDAQDIDKAPWIVRQLAKEMGGIRSGQLLFTTDASKKVFLFGAWWPWQDEKTISLRIGAQWTGLSDSEAAEVLASFKACFGV
ncbi:MAG: hypothetical protein SWE60_03000 [Thermodesulfobacteriota bacterium]|nr:hypothetical protein [Thermodesulfobacteriota bacterium]